MALYIIICEMLWVNLLLQWLLQNLMTALNINLYYSINQSEESHKLILLLILRKRKIIFNWLPYVGVLHLNIALLKNAVTIQQINVTKSVRSSPFRSFLLRVIKIFCTNIITFMTSVTQARGQIFTWIKISLSHWQNTVH